MVSELALAEHARLEAGRVTPADCERFARVMFEGRAKALVVTMGERGAWSQARGGEPREVPACEVRVVDTTGAGDVFHGAFTWSVAQGSDLGRAIEFASAAGAAATTALGGRGAVPAVEDIERLIARG